MQTIARDLHSIQAAQTLSCFFASNGISVPEHLAMEAVARVRGFPDARTMQEQERNGADRSAKAKARLTLGSGLTEVRAALSGIPNFVGEKDMAFRYEKLVARTEAVAAYGAGHFSAIVVTVHLESDMEMQRIAPYATFDYRVGNSEGRWCQVAFPEQDLNVAELGVKVLLRSVRAKGLDLTQVYDLRTS